MSEPIDCEFTKELVCPYCGYEHSDSYELDSDHSMTGCDHCGKEFEYFRNIEITYSTYKKGIRA